MGGEQNFGGRLRRTTLAAPAPAPEGALTVDRSASRGLHVEAQLGAEVADDVIDRPVVGVAL